MTGIPGGPGSCPGSGIAHAFAGDLTLQPGCEVVAVGSRSQASADAFGVPHRHASCQALVNDVTATARCSTAQTASASSAAAANPIWLAVRRSCSLRWTSTTAFHDSATLRAALICAAVRGRCGHSHGAVCLKSSRRPRAHSSASVSRLR